MATVKITFSSKVWYPTRPCQEVALCLSEDWAELTVSGYSVIIATLENAGRYLGPVGGVRQNPRDTEEYQYELTYDDTQITDAEENIVTCADIVDLIPHACLIQTMLTALAAIPADLAALLEDLESRLAAVEDELEEP